MAAPRTARQKDVRRHLLIYAGLTPFVLIAVFPIYWMAITAFKQEPDLYRMDNIPFWFNLPPTLKNFNILFHQTNYGAWIVNTMNISAWVALITLLTAVPAGYALARLRLPGAEKPVPVGVPTELIRGDVYFWGSLMGAALLVGLPVAILYNFFLDRFIQGITGGVVK